MPEILGNDLILHYVLAKLENLKRGRELNKRNLVTRVDKIFQAQRPTANQMIKLRSRFRPGGLASSRWWYTRGQQKGEGMERGWWVVGGGGKRRQ